jgi:hypothetical protein
MGGQRQIIFDPCVEIVGSNIFWSWTRIRSVSNFWTRTRPDGLYPCDSDISSKEVFWNSESVTTFALLIELYLLRKFENFSASRSHEILGRASLNIWILFFGLSEFIVQYIYLFQRCLVVFFQDQNAAPCARALIALTQDSDVG